MGRSCTVCASATAGTIDEALRDGRPASAVATEYGLEARSVQRHAKAHLGRLAAVPVDAPPSLRDPLDELAEALRVRALAGDPIVAREYRLALAAVTARHAAAAPPLDLTATPEWIDLRTRLLAALEPYPAARLAVADALA